MKSNHIYHQPCGSLSEIPDDTIDVIITSPPYNISTKKHQKNKRHNMVGYDGFGDHMPEDEYQQQQVELLNACCRVIKPGGSIFYNHKPRHADGIEINPHIWIERSDCELYQTIVWNRKSTPNHERRYQWPVFEYIFHLYRPGRLPRVNLDCAEWTSIWTIDWSETRRNAHPAPFPEEIAARCIMLADCREGEIVLDPYMGSGTTAVMAVQNGLHYVGYEISEKYIKHAMNRIRRARTERQMFEGMQPAATVKSKSKRAAEDIYEPTDDSDL